MADVNYIDGSYCATCDEYFVDKEARAEHIDASLEHPKCTVCARRFLNLHVLRNHYTLSPYHHYCRICDKLFNTAGGLEVHINYYHDCDDSDSDDEEDYDCEDREEGWEDDEAEDLYPDGFPEDSFKRDYGDDLSYEDDDSYDFEDIEDLEDPPFEFENESGTEGDVVGDEEEDEENLAEQFACPMCEKNHEQHHHAICSTPCGHIFCAPCITAALKYTHMCPICDQAGEVDQLRRIYISEQ